MTQVGWVTGATPFSARVGAAALACLRGIGEPVDFDEDEVVFHQGEPVDDVLLVESGMVRVYVCDEQGIELDLGLFGRGELLNEMSSLELGPRAASGVGHTAGTLTRVTGPRFRAFLMLNPDVRAHALDVVLHRLRRREQERSAHRANLVDDITQRVVRTLLIWAKHYGMVRADGAVVLTRISRRELALGADAPERKTNEVLRALHAVGLLIVGRRRYVLPDTTTLRRWVEDRSVGPAPHRPA